jgi:hypothetical protein
MVAHLELALSMFQPSGELLPNKHGKASRTFDEQNAFMSYQRFIAQTYFAVGDSRNQAGYNKMVGTLGKFLDSRLLLLSLYCTYYPMGVFGHTTLPC